jgi:hypothetical protein
MSTKIGRWGILIEIDPIATNPKEPKILTRIIGSSSV